LILAQDEQEKWFKQGKCGYSPEALAAAGLALHAVTDSTSPSHKGFQLWDPGVLDIGSLAIPGIAGAIEVHVAKESTILPSEKTASANLFKSYFKIAFTP